MRNRNVGVFLPALVVGAILFCAGAAHAQQPGSAPEPNFSNSTLLGIGYSANAPELLWGGSVHLLRPAGFGFFVDAKISGGSPSSRSNFMSDWTIEQALNEFGDSYFGHEDHWLVVNAGLTRVITPSLALYAGAGYGRRRAFQEFSDPTFSRGEFGYYWVEDERFTSDQLNVLGGILLRGGRRITFQFGAEAQPKGMTVGIHYALPLH